MHGVSERGPCRVLLVGREWPDGVRSVFATGLAVQAGAPVAFADATREVVARDARVVLLDLSDSEALTAIEELMGDAPRPIVALDPGVLSPADALQARNLGALDVLPRTDAPSADFWGVVARRVALVAQVRVVRHPRGRLKRRLRDIGAGDAAAPFPVVAIAASLGGPKALALLLKALPHTFPAPLLVCQHITDGFTQGLAHWLSGETALRVVEARDEERLATGAVYIAPSGHHLRVRPGGRVWLDPGPPLLGFRPSCDALLASVAESFGRRSVGVVLTGMGRDGARGLKAIRDAGGRTLVQDEASSVVWGMPREAVGLGAAEAVLPLDRIAQTLVEWVTTC